MRKQDRIDRAMRLTHAAGTATGKMANAMIGLQEAGLFKITPETLDELDSFFRVYFRILDTLAEAKVSLDKPADSPTAESVAA